MLSRTALTTLVRRFSTSPVVRSDIQQKGIPGANLPFDISNRYKLTAVFVLFFGSGLTAPLLLVRHQMLKK
ncbi:cytochrome c oxidase subunit 7c, mitochondrial [Octopus vulgaris]|uniref:Cytochrome c oxidase subunit 7C, mitochondrial n=1 Tax=Octopus vulgaris TaxID=6645 RepID=A0AA36FG14_OCTVU|nr:cytochrome c oxidase subunit 7c, mitochondrial [Octopus vulgaris]